jgi:TolB protein
VFGDVPARPITWSPDGERIALALANGILAVDAGGRGARMLGMRWPVRRPIGPLAWVGGRILVFTAAWLNDRELYAADPATGRAVALTRNRIEDTAPALSPDGRLVAFHRRKAVWVRALAGGAERRLHAGTDPAWSPDGSELAIAVGSRIEVVNARTGSVRAVVGPGGEPAWSPDGAAIAFARDGDIWAAAPDGSGAHRITSGPVFDRMPAYSPDGRRIAYRAVPADGVGVFAADAADGANVARLTSFGGRDPSWSPDGTRVVVELGSSLAIVPADGSATGHGSVPAFSPSNGVSNQPSWGRG